MPSRRQLVAGLVAAGAAGVASVSLLRGRGLKRFPYQATGLSETAYRALAAKPGWQAVAHEPEAGVRLRGLSRPPRSAGAPWVVFFPGNGGAQLDEAQQFLERLGAERDVGLQVFAYRGFDGSTGVHEAGALQRDALSVLEQLRVTGPKHLVGFSLGTSLAVAVGAQRKVTSVSLLAPLTEIDVGATGLTGRLLGGDRYETLRWLPLVTAPLLVVGGARDEVLGVEMAREVKARATAAKYVEVPATHTGVLSDPQALEAVRAFAQL